MTLSQECSIPYRKLAASTFPTVQSSIAYPEPTIFLFFMMHFTSTKFACLRLCNDTRLRKEFYHSSFIIRVQNCTELLMRYKLGLHIWVIEREMRVFILHLETIRKFRNILPLCNLLYWKPRFLIECTTLFNSFILNFIFFVKRYVRCIYESFSSFSLVVCTI